jgi:hypothetical protein
MTVLSQIGTCSFVMKVLGENVVACKIGFAPFRLEKKVGTGHLLHFWLTLYLL